MRLREGVAIGETAKVGESTAVPGSEAYSWDATWVRATTTSAMIGRTWGCSWRHIDVITTIW